MTKILFALALALLTTAASAQSRRFYDASGKSVGTSSTDSQGTTTFYDASGRVTGRSSKSGKSGDTTTIYDSTGRSVGKATNR